ncbi:MAG: hypothetical protein RLZZ301_1261 [Bacteroidota bacterium]|jgi:NAD(P)-dependent dehydrogenase (short-subunit alcohol dehydrogenase family)
MLKTVVILGASRGIGAALVERFAADPDTQVYALSRNVEQMQQRFTQANVKCIAIDLAQPLLGQFSWIPSQFQIDILINNAGYLVNKPFANLTHDDFQYSYQVNVIGIMEATQQLLPYFSANAHIVNISSIGGFQGSLKFAGLSAYSSSKAALVAFTELFAEEFKATNYRMNCLCLGAVQTEMLEQAFPGYQAPTRPEEMARFIYTFATQAGEFMNGKVIPVSTSNP